MALITAAVRAPSADNRHHIGFAIRDDGIDVRADASFVDGRITHRRLLSLLSFGAVAENLRLALTTMGHDFVPAWFPAADDSSLLLRIEWSRLTAAAAPDPLAAAIATRHTNRRFFKGPQLGGEAMQRLEAAASAVTDVSLAWCDTPPRRKALLRLIRIAEAERYRSPVLHAELFESIDFDAGWSEATAEKLAPATLEVEPFLRVPFGALRHWPVMHAANRLGAHRGLGLRAGDLPARTSPHLGVLSSTLPPDPAALQVGAAFQRVWLAAEVQGLALQPMVASAILATQSHASEGVRDRVREALKSGWDGLVGEALPMIVFRLGRAARPKVVSGRRPVETYLV